MKALYSCLWLAWVGAFFLIEFSALLGAGAQYTLSDYVWRMEGAGWSFARYVVAALLIFLAGHFLFRWFR